MGHISHSSGHGHPYNQDTSLVPKGIHIVGVPLYFQYHSLICTAAVTNTISTLYSLPALVQQNYHHLEPLELEKTIRA